MRSMTRSLLAPALLVLVSALALSGQPQADKEGWPGFPASVRYDGRLSRARIYVGLLVPRANPEKLYDLLPKAKLERFLADKKAGRLEEADGAPAKSRSITVIPWGERAEGLRSAAAALERAFGLEVVFREILADDCSRFPLVLMPARKLASGELELVQGYLAGGGIVCVDGATQEYFERLVPGAKVERITDSDLDVLALAATNRTSDNPEQIVNAIDAAVGYRHRLGNVRVVHPGRRGLVIGTDKFKLLPYSSRTARRRSKLIGQLIALAAMTSRRMRDLEGPPLAIRGATREGSRIEFSVAVPAVARVRVAKLDARVVGVDGKVRWAESLPPANGTTATFPFPAELAPCAWRLEVSWRFGDVTLLDTKTIEQLVGIVDRRVFTSNQILAGSTHAVRVYFEQSKTGNPVAGQSATVQLIAGGQTIAKSSGISDETGTADFQLRVPEDAKPGAAQLLVGETEFNARIVARDRISLVQDRSIYRETDTVHARMLVHRFPSGKPAAGVPVCLRLHDGAGAVIAERTVATSEWGIASGSFDLVDAAPGDYMLVAESRSARATRRFEVSAFELPRFKLRARPDKITCRRGERVALRIVASYVDGAPVAGARVIAKAKRFRAKLVTGKTGADGGFDYVLARAERSGSVEFRVSDSDGRTQDTLVPIEVHDSAIRCEIRRLGHVVFGKQARFELSAHRWLDGKPVSGTAKITVAGDNVGEIELHDGRATFETTVRAWVFSIVAKLTTSDDQTAQAQRTLSATPVSTAYPLVLAPALVQRVGQSPTIEILASDGPVMLDVLRGGAQLRTLHGVTKDGSAEIVVELDDDMVGALDLYAYRIVNGQPKGTRQPILVLRGRSLDVTASQVTTGLRPGDTASIDVEVKDEHGEPTAAALGYWAVDTALDEVAEPVVGDESYFDAIPRNASAGLVEIATRRPDFEAAIGLFGAPEKHAHKFAIRHRLLTELRRNVETAAARLFEKRLAEIRKTFVEAIARVPLSEFRRAASFQQLVRSVLRHGTMSESLLVDPWGQPLLLWKGWGDYVWSSPRGFTGAIQRSWWGSQIWKDLPLELRALVRLVRRTLIEDEETVEQVDSAFDSNAFNDVVGLGGGAGGRFGGRGRRRRLSRGADVAVAASDAMRTRTDFRPTLCFVPETIIGPSGRARLTVPLSDSLTTWRMRLVASDVRGAVGVGETNIVVTQPLSIEPWVSRLLTVGDRVELPVGVRNGTAKVLDVAIGVDAIPALGLAEPDLAEIPVDGKASAAHRFELHAKQPGIVGLRVHARAGPHADAVKRNVRVRPSGRRVESTRTMLLADGRPWRTEWNVADSPVAPASLSLSLYPSVLADTLQGFEGLIREPHGCFEQTSSTLYPMVLALRYMKRTGQIVPEVAESARAHVESGYRRLMSYEVRGSGGFELFGRNPAHTMLTAYGLHEFCDMSEVHAVDPQLIPRIQKFLNRRQQKDGSFAPARLGGGASAPIDRIATTSYAAWALARSGLVPTAALRWIENRLDSLSNDYVCGLAAMAFLTTDPKSRTGRTLADRLARRVEHEGRLRYWQADTRTCVGARGSSADVETTAIAIQVLLASGRHPELLGPALEWLVDQRRPSGMFGSTQSTVLALQALLAADAGTGKRGPATVTVRVDGTQVANRTLPADAVVPLRIDLAKSFRAGKHEVTVALKGQRRIRAQQTLTAWTPWAGPIKNGPLDLSVKWPATVAVGRDAKLAVAVSNTSDEVASLVTVEIGIPPGCSVNRRGLSGAKVARVERGEGRLVLYLDRVEPKKTLRFEIPFTARYGLDVSTGPSKAYEYYTPGAATVIPPSRLAARR